MTRSLGILLTTPPDAGDLEAVIGLGEAALAGGRRVRIFVMYEGVRHLNDPRFLELADKGAEIAVCAHNAIERAIEQPPGVVWGGQYDLATMVAECDRFLAFN